LTQRRADIIRDKEGFDESTVIDGKGKQNFANLGLTLFLGVLVYSSGTKYEGEF
jgi:hypothetical protein